MSVHVDQLIRLLTEFLGEDARPMRPETRFDELGLDSLSGLRFARKAQDALGVEIDLEWMFDYPTIAAFAEVIDARTRACGEQPAVRAVS